MECSANRKSPKNLSVIILKIEQSGLTVLNCLEQFVSDLVGNPEDRVFAASLMSLSWFRNLA